MAMLIRLVFRIVALVPLALGLAAAGFLALVLAASDGRESLPLGQVWFQHDPFLDLLHTASLPLLGAIVERRINPFLWDPVAVTWLNWPSWMALAAAAGLFLILAGLLFALTRKGGVQ